MTKKPLPKILPCPFIDDDPVLERAVGNGYFVRASSMDASAWTLWGPTAPSKTGAIQEWNKAMRRIT